VNDDLLSPDELLTLLTDLADDLDRNDVRGQLFIVGGAAMALAYGARRLTQDIDAVFEPTAVIYEAARRVAEARGIPEDWLNDAVEDFLPGRDANATVLFQRPGLAVRIASPRYLFALKAIAARSVRDSDDLLVLFRISGFASVDEALESVTSFYPAHLIPPKTEFLLRELL
jgi:hypothetical protein